MIEDFAHLPTGAIFVPSVCADYYMGISKNEGTQKWMVCDGKSY